MTVIAKQTIEIDRAQRGFDELDFVARAVSDDVTRYFMNYIHVEHPEDDTPIAVSTNGHRLHFWQSDSVTLEPGAYRVEKRQKSKLILSKLLEDRDIGQFPNWRRVIPSRHDLEADTITFALKGKTKNDLLANVGPQYTKLVKKWGAAFNVRYLLDLEGFTFDVRAHLLPLPQDKTPNNQPCNKAHMFDDEKNKVHAVIMPMLQD